jgi:hypothetical protein
MIDKIIEELEKLKIENAPMYYDDDYEQGYKQAMNDVEQIVKKYENDRWISVKEDIFPEEYLCKDGEYDPSRYVLCQLKNGDMIKSRYWNHRHCKDTVIEQPWLDLETWHEVVAYRELPQPYKGE